MKKFRAVVDHDGCSKCGNGQTWMVIDPRGVGGGTSYGCREEADDIARSLNEAFALGRKSVARIDRKRIGLLVKAIKTPKR